MGTTMEQKTELTWSEMLQGAVIHWPTLPDTIMENELTDKEIAEIRTPLVNPTTKFWDYLEFARQVINAHEEKKWKNEQLNNGLLSLDSLG